MALQVLALMTWQVTGILGAGGVSPRTPVRRVGTMLLGLMPARDNETQIAPDGGGLENIVVQAWYPAIDVSRQGDTRGEGLDRPLLGASIAVEPERFPFILFNPGWNGNPGSHLFQITALVRAGFVVIGVWHRPNPKRLDRFLDFSSEATYQATMGAIAALTYQDAADNLRVVEAFRRGITAPLSTLGSRLDYGRIGILGYSYGGAVAAQTCWLDHRVRAGINMDGWLFGAAASQGFEQPFLEMSDATPPPGPADLVRGDIRQRLEAKLNMDDATMRQTRLARFGGYTLIVDGTNHQSFVDPQARSRIGQMLAWLPHSWSRLAIITDYSVAFFRHYLNNEHATLLDAKESPFPEAHLTVWKPNSETGPR